LRAGPHTVGFESRWELDWGRTYNLVFPDRTRYAAGKAPRPIVINTWYPAAVPTGCTPMRHRDYLRIETDDPRLTRFAAELAAYQRLAVCRDVTGKATAQLTDSERALLDEFWETPRASFRDATPAKGEFPLVIWRGGSGASIDDNAVLCEFLASHGYIVVTSAFQRGTGCSFNIDAFATSVRDTEFLIRYAREHSRADWQHIGLAGHSAGAQSALLFQSQHRSPVDALVSVDSTQDYFCPTTTGWELVGRHLLKRKKNINIPLLFIANPHAFFEVADALEHADRYYLTASDLDHEDFVSLGIARRIFKSRANPQNQDLRASLETARAGYETICEAIRRFFRAFLCDEPADRDNLPQEYQASALGGRAFGLEHVPVGVTGPEPFRTGSPTAPAPRQFRSVLAALGVEATIALMKHYHALDSTPAIFGGGFGYALIDELFEKERPSDAVAFHRLYMSFGQDILSMYLEEGELHRRSNAKAEARRYYEKALASDPGNDVATRGLDALRKPSKSNES
jgi:pimeloyl-ACP methyl ester carboxylesterase